MFSAKWFFDLDSKLRALGLDSDAQSFDDILKNLNQRKICSPDEFVDNCAYVILAGGFSQKTAKKIHANIMQIIQKDGACFDTLIKVFNNKNKISAICKIWENRINYCDGYYKLSNLDDRLKYLQKLPHIGKITANHLARNLGEDIVKYDIWIQRLGVVYVRRPDLIRKINNGNLCEEIKSACDDMFAHLVSVTGLPRGYIDVVLWRGLQQGLIR
jgi:DhnA family fructose-bisphosphate aldolase class Ia